jgi:hypothetical protein
MVTTTEADKAAYCNCMEQVKRRLALVRAVTTGSICTGDEGADAELACMQVRKALELIAFATLAANRDRYSQIRADVQNEWRAKRILDKLKQLHPDFYPVPVTPVRVAPGQWHFDEVPGGYLTSDEFVDLYDKCSEVVHEWNPFRSGSRRVNFGWNIAEWAGRIERLLEFHHVRLVDQVDVLLVRLTDPSDGKAHVLTGTPQTG